MKPTLIEAVKTLFKLQRWNALPRVETWVEAENIADCAHIGLALGTCLEEEFPDDLIHHFLIRCLLKPLNKHFLSDVPYHIRKVIGELAAGKSVSKD